MGRRSVRAAVAIVAVATALPFVAYQWAEARTNALAGRLSELSGVAVAIDSIEVGLTGELTIGGLRFGDMVRLSSVSAAVDIGSILRGGLRIAQVAVEEPRLRLRIEDDGSSDLGAALSRLAARRRRHGQAGATTRRGRPPRVVLNGGVVRVVLGDEGELTARSVALHPRADGIRMTTGEVTVSMRGPLPVSARFPRSAADLDLVSGRLVRALAPGGRVHVAGFEGSATASLGIGGGARVRAEIGRGWIEVQRAGGISNARFDGFPLAVFSPVLPSSIVATDATMTGAIRFGAGGAFELDAELAKLVAVHPNLAESQVEVNSRVLMAGRREGRRVDVRAAKLSAGDVNVLAAGWLELGRSLAFEAAVELEKTSCQDALEAVPEAMRRRLTGLRLRGDIAGRLVLAYRDSEAVVEPTLEHSCAVVADGAHADPHRLDGAFDLDIGHRVLAITEGAGRARLSALPRYLPGAFIAAEDARFYSHDGFDTRQIERSMAANLASGKVVRGGSTISQQMVKNVYLDNGRTIARKLEEAIITWRVEATTRKSRILAVYLQLLELGPDVRGIDEAARYWFNRSAAKLEPVQAAFLAALTRAPATESERIRLAGGVPEALRARVDSILRSMRHAEFISRPALRRALEAPLLLEHIGAPVPRPGSTLTRAATAAERNQAD